MIATHSYARNSISATPKCPSGSLTVGELRICLQIDQANFRRTDLERTYGLNLRFQWKKLANPQLWARVFN